MDQSVVYQIYNHIFLFHYKIMRYFYTISIRKKELINALETSEIIVVRDFL
jgi:hypothetical protein